MKADERRRMILQACAAGGLMSFCGVMSPFSSISRADERPPRLAASTALPDVLVPPGYEVRIVARSGEYPVATAKYRWHHAPDGGGTVATADGGWIYVSNSELGSGRGGAGALRFSASGNVVDAYPVLTGSSRNCAGSMMPWGRFLSCEETARGRVWECDPYGLKAAVARPSLGVFAHEDVALDPLNQQLYLTEDNPAGRLYRFTPSQHDAHGVPVLEDGQLAVARRVNRQDREILDWLPLPDPAALRKPTRKQVPASSSFNGSEGIGYSNGAIYFTTKGDNRVWRYTIASQEIRVFYDAARYPEPILTGVDNIAVSRQGTIYVAEDGGDMQIVMLDATGNAWPVVQLLGQDRSEMTGIAFSPDGTRLYFSSQRGIRGSASDGITYEMSGPFA